MTSPLPDYDSLPIDERGWRSGWAVFGPDDQLGLINLLTPERATAAAGLVVRGVNFPLDMPLGAFDPPLNPRREPPHHTVIRQPTIGFDDAWDRVFPQAGSQWDSLAHVGIDRSAYYNGATAEEVESGRNGIDQWARHGIVGRAVLLDVESILRNRGAYSPGDRVTIGVDELEAARAVADVTFEPGDILLLHTGFARWYRDQDADSRRRLPGNVTTSGLEPSEAVCRYLWNTHASAIGADNFAVEAWPADFAVTAQPFGFIHQMLIGSFGMALGELWWLDALARDCRDSGVYTGMFVSSPWNAPGGISSPANAVVIK